MNEGHLPGRPVSKAKLAASLSRFDKREVNTGIKDEKEHTKDPEVAAQIALDHLRQDPHYYTDIAPVEKKIERFKKLKKKKHEEIENVFEYNFFSILETDESK